ncbi:MAG: hypothetical protein R3325_15670, partial [Thermoanaerobaculia bacterium]|nr:hypothetical protein [Thermoanaerobaculia bacterium]
TAWHIPPGPVWLDRPLTVAVTTVETAPSARLLEPDGAALELALGQEPDAPRRWSARLAPRRPGWHRLESGGGEGADSGAWFYVQPPAAWQALSLARRQEATRRAAVLASARPLREAPLQGPATALRVALLAVAVGALGGVWGLSSREVGEGVESGS